jgi:hypothetical protein
MSVNTRGVSLFGAINIYDNTTAYIKYISLMGSNAGTNVSTGGLYIYNNSTIIVDDYIQIVNFVNTSLYVNNESTLRVLGNVGATKNILLGDAAVNGITTCKEIAIYINNNSSFISDCSILPIYGTIFIDNNSTMNIEKINYIYNSSTLNTTKIGIFIEDNSSLICNTITTESVYTSVIISHNSFVQCHMNMNIKLLSGFNVGNYGLLIQQMSKLIIGNINNSAAYLTTNNGLYIDCIQDFAAATTQATSSTGIQILSNSELITNYIYIKNCHFGIYTNNSKIIIRPNSSGGSDKGFILEAKSNYCGILSVKSMLYFDKIEILNTVTSLVKCIHLTYQSNLYVYGNTTILNRGSEGAFIMETNSYFETTYLMTINDAAVGLNIDNSRALCDGITLNTISNTGYVIKNNSFIEIKNGITINTALIGFNIDNSKVTSNGITLNNITNTGIIITNNSILTNNNTSLARITIANNTCNIGIQISNNSIILCGTISINYVATIGISITNKSYLCVSNFISILSFGAGTSALNTEYGMLITKKSKVLVVGTIGYLSIKALNTSTTTSYRSNGLYID